MRKSLWTPEHDRLCELLTEERHARGLTQTALAEKLGEPQPFVARYETGERRLDVIEFFRVARALGADPYKILKRLRL